MKHLLPCLALAFSGCAPSLPEGYAPREGDIVFQSLPHSPLSDAIEGSTGSPYSHCGIVAFKANEWVVIEALGTVRETSFLDWIDRGREDQFSIFRLDASFSNQIPDIIDKARKYLGRPYDIHYSFDDERIYCSELIQKAVRDATNRVIGKNQRLGELNWQPFESTIRAIEGTVPLDREMITPRALTEASELSNVFEHQRTAED